MTTCRHSRDIASEGTSLPHIHNIEEILRAVEAAQSELFILAIKEQQTQPPPTLFLNKNMRVFFSLFPSHFFPPQCFVSVFILRVLGKLTSRRVR